MQQKDNLELIQKLQKEIPILTTQIRALYRELDKKFYLRGAEVPVTFGFDENLLGSYTRPQPDQTGLLSSWHRADEESGEHFHFSLLFVGYSVEHPLGKEDRIDLYKHEYAHYMQYHITIPKEYTFQPGLHGSAWKYCCSLVGAVPTPYYRVGEALMKKDYDKVLKNPIYDRTVTMRDNYRREKTYQNNRNSVVQYEIGEEVKHPKFGTGYVEHIEQMECSVRLHIRFGEELKIIDQKWLLRTKYQKAGDR